MHSTRQERWVAVLLFGCAGLVIFWMVASRMATRPFDALRLGAEDFNSFNPGSAAWSTRLVHVKATPTEPTIVAYVARRLLPSTMDTVPPVLRVPLLVRLVHGYNMEDCMRIKQYRVELLEDRRRRPGHVLPPDVLPMQVWRLIAPDGHRSVWISSMLRASDFVPVDVDTRDMAFPRVGTPDDPAWAPTGLKWSSFRHPIRNFRFFLRAKWNASRSDLLTFLRLRQPAWASNVLLTMVSEYRGPSLTADQEPEALAHVEAVHLHFLHQLMADGE